MSPLKAVETTPGGPLTLSLFYLVCIPGYISGSTCLQQPCRAQGFFIALEPRRHRLPRELNF